MRDGLNESGAGKRDHLGNLSFALLLGTLWLGMAAGTATLLSTLGDMASPTAAPATTAALRLPHSVADSAGYKTWDDVATAPLPGDGAERDEPAVRSTAPRAAPSPQQARPARPQAPHPATPHTLPHEEDRAPPQRGDGIVDL